jgi:hypothetical protein
LDKKLGLVMLPFAVALAAGCEGSESELETLSAAQTSMAEACGFSEAPTSAPAASASAGAATERKTGALYGSRANGYFWGSADTHAANNTFINTRTTIPVCWEDDPNALPGQSAEQVAAYRDAHRALVEQTWSRHARLSLAGWNTCVSSSSGIRIRLCSSSSSSWTNPDGTTGTCPGGGWVGVNNDGLNGAGIAGQPNGLRFNTSQQDAVFVHEFGHALGFIHDEVRHKAAGGSETDGTYPCNGQKSGGTPIYTIAQWSQPVPSSSDAVTYGGLNWGSNGGSSGFPHEWSSIMAYCRNPVSRPAPYMSNYDVAAAQRVYGRRQPGTLVSPRSKCAETTTNNRIILSNVGCDEFQNVQEFLPVLSNTDTWNLRSTKTDGTQVCIAPTSTADGALVTPQTCSNGTDWRFRNMYVVGFGGQCLDLDGGVLAAGRNINMWSCGMFGGANQKWTRLRTGQIRFGTTSWCAELDANANGRLKLQACDAADPRQIFSFSSTGQIMHWTGSANECLDVAGPNDAEFHPASGLGAWGGPDAGQPVTGFSCNDSLNQRWHLSGPIVFGADTSLCLHRDAQTPGTQLSLRTCNGSEEQQVWDYYF